jgi:hypothetical protein
MHSKTAALSTFPQANHVQLTDSVYHLETHLDQHVCPPTRGPCLPKPADGPGQVLKYQPLQTALNDKCSNCTRHQTSLLLKNPFLATLDSKCFIMDIKTKLLHNYINYQSKYHNWEGTGFKNPAFTKYRPNEVAVKICRQIFIPPTFPRHIQHPTHGTYYIPSLAYNYNHNTTQMESKQSSPTVLPTRRQQVAYLLLQLPLHSFLTVQTSPP